MDFCVVLIESKRYVAVKKDWIENPIVGQQTKLFYSKNNSAIPDFSLPKRFYLYAEIDAVYDAFVCREFDDWDEAVTYAENTRVRTAVNYATHSKFQTERDFEVPVETIILTSDAEHETDVSKQSVAEQMEASQSQNEHASGDEQHAGKSSIEEEEVIEAANEGAENEPAKTQASNDKNGASVDDEAEKSGETSALNDKSCIEVAENNDSEMGTGQVETLAAAASADSNLTLNDSASQLHLSQSQNEHASGDEENANLDVNDSASSKDETEVKESGTADSSQPTKGTEDFSQLGQNKAISFSSKPNSKTVRSHVSWLPTNFN